MRTHRQHALATSRAGFTLVEVLIVMVVLGVLGGLAIPNLKDAVYQADAVSIVADMNAVSMAVAQYYEENGSYPKKGKWGQTPAELQPYLGDREWGHRDLEYRLRSGHRVSFDVRFDRDHPIGEALKRYRRPGKEAGSVNWTPKKIEFRLYCDASKKKC